MRISAVWRVTNENRSLKIIKEGIKILKISDPDSRKLEFDRFSDDPTNYKILKAYITYCYCFVKGGFYDNMLGNNSQSVQVLEIESQFDNYKSYTSLDRYDDFYYSYLKSIIKDLSEEIKNELVYLFEMYYKPKINTKFKSKKII